MQSEGFPCTKNRFPCRDVKGKERPLRSWFLEVERSRNPGRNGRLVHQGRWSIGNLKQRAPFPKVVT